MDRPGHFPGKKWSARAAILINLIVFQVGQFDLYGLMIGSCLARVAKLRGRVLLPKLRGARYFALSRAITVNT
jgi:hypothetical protein